MPTFEDIMIDTYETTNIGPIWYVLAKPILKIYKTIAPLDKNRDLLDALDYEGINYMFIDENEPDTMYFTIKSVRKNLTIGTYLKDQFEKKYNCKLDESIDFRSEAGNEYMRKDLEDNYNLQNSSGIFDRDSYLITYSDDEYEPNDSVVWHKDMKKELSRMKNLPYQVKEIISSYDSREKEYKEEIEKLKESLHINTQRLQYIEIQNEKLTKAQKKLKLENNKLKNQLKNIKT